MKIWLITLLALTPAVWADSAEPVLPKDEIAGWEADAPEDPNAPDINWVDTSHAYATHQAQALTEWMDDFFGDPNYDLEKAESQLRVEWINDWDEQDDYATKLRLRGKLQLPKISRRLDLVFSDEDGDELTEEERESEDRVGLQYNLGEQNRSRLDLTLGLNWNKLRPGVRYRNQGPISDNLRYRYTQRLQWENDEGFYTTGQFNLDRYLDDNNIVRWSSRAVYGEETEEVEWRTRLALLQRLRQPDKNHQLAISYFASVNGATNPHYVRNYSLGMLVRRQMYRDYLFVELEPSYNLRRRREEQSREGAWNIVLRIEIALERDLTRIKRDRATDSPQQTPPDENEQYR